MCWLGLDPSFGSSSPFWRGLFSTSMASIWLKELGSASVKKNESGAVTRIITIQDSMIKGMAPLYGTGTGPLLGTIRGARLQALWAVQFGLGELLVQSCRVFGDLLSWCFFFGFGVILWNLQAPALDHGWAIGVRLERRIEIAEHQNGERQRFVNLWPDQFLPCSGSESKGCLNGTRVCEFPVITI